MVNRNEIRPTRSDNSSLNQRHTSADFSTAKKYNTDDVIVSLANAYENKRARQVGEWESMQVRSYRRPAA
jgi:hypothetical protein